MCEQHVSPSSRTLKITGKLGVERNEQELVLEVSAALENGAKVVCLDLAGISYVDSAGLGSLIRCTTICSAAGASLRLLNVAPQLRNLLTLARLDTIMEVAPGSDVD